MNKELMKQAGFEKEINMKENFVCPTCGKEVNPFGLDETGFRNAISRKEYFISGMCQKCQDSVSGKD
ncbi:MAG: hypothetical protein KAS32_14575 [Candidatus Peribacteraceae bacterium]|nr:hypothetical protein [Candidatus Peribacteraceae bacterium]